MSIVMGITAIASIVVGLVIFVFFLRLLFGARRLDSVPSQSTTDWSTALNRAPASFDEDGFDVWLASNRIQTAGMTKSELAKLRQRYIDSN